MATITLGGVPVHTQGELPLVGSKASDFYGVTPDLSEVTLSSFVGNKVILNIFPSVDTGVCAMSVRKFHQEASLLNGVKILCISKDLPFALGRFCAAEGIDNLVMVSDFRGDFEKKYPIAFTDGPLKGVLSRAIIIIDENGTVLHTEQVAETKNEPNYAKAIEVLK